MEDGFHQHLPDICHGESPPLGFPRLRPRLPWRPELSSLFAVIDIKGEIKDVFVGRQTVNNKTNRLFPLQTSSPRLAGKTRRWIRRSVSGLPLCTFPVSASRRLVKRRRRRSDAQLELSFIRAEFHVPPPHPHSRPRPPSRNSTAANANLIGIRSSGFPAKKPVCFNGRRLEPRPAAADWWMGASNAVEKL